MSLLCEVFRSPRKAEMYLYVERGMDLEHLPEALLQQFGEPESVMILMLSPERKARQSQRTRGYQLHWGAGLLSADAPDDGRVVGPGPVA